MLETIIKNHKDHDSPKLFSEDLERRLNDIFSECSQDERKTFISQLLATGYVHYDDSLKYISDVMCPQFSHHEYVEIYSKMSIYRDLLRYLVIEENKQSHMINKSDRECVHLLFNIFMLKTFWEYCSFIKINGFNNNYGRFKYACFFDCSLIQTDLKYAKFDESFLVRCTVNSSCIINSTITKSLWYNTKFDSTNLDNNVYTETNILYCIFDRCSASFSSFLNSKLMHITYQNASCQKIEIINTALERFTGSNLVIQNLTLKTDTILKSIFNAVHIKTFTFESTCPFDPIQWVDTLVRKGEERNPNEGMIYKIILFGKKLNSDERKICKYLPHLLVWDYINNNTIIDINEITFRNGKIENCKPINCLSLSNSNLALSDFTDIVIKKSNLCGINAENGQFKNSHMNLITATESLFKGANLYNSDWNIVNLTDSNLEIVNATNAKFSFVVFDESNCNELVFANGTANYCSFKFVRLNKNDWSDIKLRFCYFRYCKADVWFIPNAIISNCSFYHNDIHRLTVYSSEFHNCKFYKNYYNDSVIRATIFTNCIFYNNILENCKISNVSMVNSTVHNPSIQALTVLSMIYLDNIKIKTKRKTVVVSENNKDFLLNQMIKNYKE